MLGPSDRRALYTFDLVVTRPLSLEERERVRQIATWMKPAQTHLGRIREPELPLQPGPWKLGLSRLSYDTILHGQEGSV